MFVLSIDGTILKERYLVSANYPGKVTEVFVKEGDKVQVGTQLARIESFEMIQELANITFRDSDLAIREGQLQESWPPSMPFFHWPNAPLVKRK